MSVALGFIRHRPPLCDVVAVALQSVVSNGIVLTELLLEKEPASMQSNTMVRQPVLYSHEAMWLICAGLG